MKRSDHTQDKYSLKDITTVTITRNKSQTLFTGSHCGFWRRIKELSLSECALRTPGGRSVLWTFQGDSTWFFRARTRYTVPITHHYNHTLFTGSHCGFWRRIKELSLSECALRTPGGRSVLWTFQGDSTWFFRARTRYTVPITHHYNHTLFTDGHCGFWRRIKGYRYQNLQSKNTWGEVSTLNHPCRGTAHDSFKKIKLSFPFRPRANHRVLPEPHSSAAMGGPQSIDLTPKGKGGTCHCQRFFQSLVVLLRPTESDYCRVPKVRLIFEHFQ